MSSPELKQGFYKICPSDLDFSVRDFIKANILTAFHEYQMENVASRAYRRFSNILPIDLIFDPTFLNLSEESSR